MQNNEYRKYTLIELIDRLGLDYTANGKMDCPFCNKKKKLNLDFEGERWRCPACNTGGSVLHFFAAYHLGYLLPKHPSKSESAAVLKELRPFMDGYNSTTSTTVPKVKPRAKVSIAPDFLLDAVYSVFAKIPALKLLPPHKDNLLARGLNEETIRRNGYLSVPENYRFPDFYIKLYEDSGGDKMRKKICSDAHCNLKKEQVIMGLMIAHYVQTEGLEPRGVPGFFEFGDRWCFWNVPGILIPTRNMKGQIVVWQVRKDKTPKTKKAMRYITVSYGALPGHVTDTVSRCHFPLANSPFSEKAPVLLTEGPLKADVATYLLGKPVTFIAIPGINTTVDLYRLPPVLLEAGISRIYNAFDMDRLTNINVRTGSAAIVAEFQKQGVTIAPLYWGQQYAADKYMSLSLLAHARNVRYQEPSCGNIFERLNAVASALDSAGVKHSTFRKANGEEVDCYWDPTTKGIDDYQLTCG